MLDMVKNAILLFFQGRLYADPPKVYRQLAIGVGIAVAVFLLALFAHLPVLAAAGVAGFVGGAVQPYLFKDLRFR